MATILELREKLGDLILDYDKAVKENLILEAKYDKEVGEKIHELSVIEGQTIICQEALKMDKADLDLDEIIKNVDKLKDDVNSSILQFQKKQRDFQEVLKNTSLNSKEDLAKFEEEYRDFILKHHSALIVFIPEPHDKACKYMRSCYILNDYKHFKDFNHPDILLNVDDIEYTETQNEELYIKQYNTYIEGFTKELEKIHGFDERLKHLRELLSDDILLAKHENMLRTRLYQEKENCIKLMQECKNLFPDEVKFAL